MSILLLIIGLVLFVCLVIVHEFGHFIAARRNGVKIEEFAIGFPPKLWSHKTKGGWLFSVNLLPLGGFVRLKGEHDADTEPGSYGQASLWAKTKIMLAGVVMNLLAAFVLLTILGWVGMPTIIDNQFAVARDTKVIQHVQNQGVVGVDEVVKGSPADHIGLHAGDILLSVGGTATHDPTAVHDIAKAHANQPTTVSFRHDGQTISRTVTLGNGQGDAGYLGVGVQSNETGLELRRFTWSAPIEAVGFMKQVTVLTLRGLWTAIRGLGSTIAGLVTVNKQARQAGQTNATQDVGGPIRIFYLLKDGSSLGYQFVLLIVAVISLTLALMNVLPIPALDGGRLFVTYLFRAFRRPLKQRTEEWIHGTGFVVLMILFVLISIVDWQHR